MQLRSVEDQRLGMHQAHVTCSSYDSTSTFHPNSLRLHHLQSIHATLHMAEFHISNPSGSSASTQVTSPWLLRVLPVHVNAFSLCFGLARSTANIAPRRVSSNRGGMLSLSENLDWLSKLTRSSFPSSRYCSLLLIHATIEALSFHPSHFSRALTHGPFLPYFSLALSTDLNVFVDLLGHHLHWDTLRFHILQ